MSNLNQYIVENNIIMQYVGNAETEIIPEEITGINDMAFNGATVKKVVLPKSMKRIDRGAFRFCHNLEEIVIPEGITAIGENAFSGCLLSKGIKLPDSLTTIGCGAFSNTWIEKIVIPDNVQVVGERAFWCSGNLKEVVLPKGLQRLADFVVRGCSKLEKIEIPNTVATIGRAAFYECHKLKQVIIPNSVTAIGGSAFGECIGLESINLPESICEIGDEAFFNCKNLKNFNIESADFVIDVNIFGKTLPKGLIPKLFEMAPHMSDAALRKHYFNAKAWNMLDIDMQAKAFIMWQGKSFRAAYQNCILDDSVDQLGRKLLENIPAKLSAKECTTLANYILLFYKRSSAEVIRSVYACLKESSAASKVLRQLEGNAELMELIQR